jgi:hypothetical protein
MIAVKSNKVTDEKQRKSVNLCTDFRFKQRLTAEDESQNGIQSEKVAC